jgi:hypothetical protein
MIQHSSAGDGLTDAGHDAGPRKSGRIVRIGTALGSYLVVIVNDLGPVADCLTREIEREVIERLRAHRDIAPEMATVDVQRGELDYESHDL